MRGWPTTDVVNKIAGPLGLFSLYVTPFLSTPQLAVVVYERSRPTRGNRSQLGADGTGERANGFPVLSRLRTPALWLTGLSIANFITRSFTVPPTTSCARGAWPLGF